MLSFKEQVLSAVKQIPEGETRSYGEVAQAAGHPGAARAVGRIMAANKDPEVPCHRVIRADGDIGGYNGGKEKKRERLNAEGALI